MIKRNDLYIMTLREPFDGSGEDGWRSSDRAIFERSLASRVYVTPEPFTEGAYRGRRGLRCDVANLYALDRELIIGEVEELETGGMRALVYGEEGVVGDITLVPLTVERGKAQLSEWVMGFEPDVQDTLPADDYTLKADIMDRFFPFTSLPETGNPGSDALATDPDLGYEVPETPGPVEDPDDADDPQPPTGDPRALVDSPL